MPDRRGFGTFGGVFTPCTLTILGVIMFLRFGYVAGNAGLWQCLLVVLAAKTITTLTSLSLAAIATNTRVRGGGAYYLISRSLGVEFGGAIGVVFYLAQAISVAMYVIGFTEALTGTFPPLAGYFTELATLTNAAAFACVYVGAGWTIKLQYGILAILAAAVVSFFAGAAGRFDAATLLANLDPAFAEGQNFLTIFALFFPAVTGVMAGANMSGDLANPAKSIPKGTLAAVVVTGGVYLAMAVALCGAAPAETLKSDRLVVATLSAVPVLITAGVFAATLSSALGSMMGAPRILQAFARDGVFRPLRFFEVGSGQSLEPRRATVLTFLIAQTCVLLGDLDAIAPVITMFFMITYGLLNLASFYESVTGNPSYRPTFRFGHWSLSLLGAAGCLAVMVLINWQWAAGAIVVIAVLHEVIRRGEVEGRWGDLQSGVAFERARRSLLRLEEEAYHPKNWRPTILALSGHPETRPPLSVFGHWLTAGHGVLTIAQVVPGDVGQHAERQSGFVRQIRRFITDQGVAAFPAVVVSETVEHGVESLVQCHGIGGVRPNTVMLGWPGEGADVSVFGRLLRTVARNGRSLVIAKLPRVSDPDEAWDVPDGPIDVWWRGQKNGTLMLLLAHLMHRNPEWRGNPIRLLRVVPNEEAADEVRGHAEELSALSRIPVDATPVIADDPLPAIAAESAAASLVLFGFEPPGEGSEDAFFGRLRELAADLPRVLFLSSAGGMELES